MRLALGVFSLHAHLYIVIIEESIRLHQLGHLHHRPRQLPIIDFMRRHRCSTTA